ncbi:hypothetical protein BDV96DRAFT_608011 [Lophiotrema nucula]|uniref:Ankyrin repeat-containing domain protein n=1 Tax=Lophiotrema nucula TaxID=690887 RepID=A0A6A5YHA5_9PLEO|nr:hypothetical protein BDV96DRAFT_608011 [Lophiotrema nucula]
MATRGEMVRLDVDYNSDSSSDFKHKDWLVTDYGDDPIIPAVREPERLRYILKQRERAGDSRIDIALFAAITIFSFDSVEVLLAFGADPNETLPYSLKVEPFVTEPDCVYEAEKIDCEGARETSNRTLRLLLDSGADSFAVRRGPSGVSRSVFHAILQHGGRVSPFLTHASFGDQDIEHRDPNGRTLLLSLCCSSLGADVAVSACLDDVVWNPTTGSYWRDPMPGPSNSHSLQSKSGMIPQILGQEPHHDVPSSHSSQSLLEKFIELGADLTAVDHSGKNIIHHLLEARDGRPVYYYSRPLLNKASVKRVLETHPNLANLSDHRGNYPIHAAILRWLHYPQWSYYFEQAGIVDSIKLLVLAGGDPSIEDCSGHNAFSHLSSDNRFHQNQRPEIESILKLHSLKDGAREAGDKGHTSCGGH